MKNLKDYIGKPYNIICDNKEEWDAIVDLAIQLDYLVDGKNNTYIKGCYSPNCYLGLNAKENLIKENLPCSTSGRTEIKASEFLPTIEPKEVDKWIGKTVRITQEVSEKGKIGKVLSITPDHGDKYYDIEGLIHPYTENQFEEVLIDSKGVEVDKSKAVVHCKTQEEWDFVTEKLGYKWEFKTWSTDKELSCINLKGKYSDKITYYSKENYYIYSFDEWCKEFGHSMKVEYIEIVAQSAVPHLRPHKQVIGKIFKVEEELGVDYRIKDDKGRDDVIAKNRVKPSTMEAYDRQESAKNIGVGPNGTTTSVKIASNQAIDYELHFTTFKTGDKIKVIKNYFDSVDRPKIEGMIGTFIRYTNSTDWCDINKYPYKVNVEGIEYNVHKIEHYKEKKSLDLSKPFCILLTRDNKVRVQNILGGGYFNNSKHYEFTDITSYYGLSIEGKIHGESALVPLNLTKFNNNIVTIEELEEAYSRLGTQPAIRRDTYKVVGTESGRMLGTQPTLKQQQAVGRTQRVDIIGDLNIFDPHISGINVDRVSAFNCVIRSMTEFIDGRFEKPKEVKLIKPTKTKMFNTNIEPIKEIKVKLIKTNKKKTNYDKQN